MARGGYVDRYKKHRCTFHGVGCRLQLSRDRIVDWDYGHEGRTDGFDLWRLTNNLRSRRKLRRVLPLDELEEAFVRACAAGAIVRHPSARYDNLFYLLADLQVEYEGPDHAG